MPSIRPGPACTFISIWRGARSRLVEDGTSEVAHQVSGSWTQSILGWRRVASLLKDSMSQTGRFTVGPVGRGGLQPAWFAGFCPDSERALLCIVGSKENLCRPKGPWCFSRTQGPGAVRTHWSQARDTSSG